MTEQPRTRAEKITRTRSRLKQAEKRIAKSVAGIAVQESRIDVLSREAQPLTHRQLTGTANPETDRGLPSFVLAARMHRRHNTTGVNKHEGFREPILDLYEKTVARQFAQAHGIAVPHVYGEWPDPDAVRWDSLPDHFVLKSSRGGGGINVFPLVRDGDEFIDRMAKEPISRQDVTAKLWKKHDPRAVYFAEELLIARGGSPGDLPHDIKVFCCYGEPVLIEVRAEDWSRTQNTVQRMRTFLPDGTEIFNARALIPHGSDVTTPTDFGAIRAASTVLSGAIRRPLERLDFYETDRGLVFGEVTQNAGRPPALVAEWDRRFGQQYENGYARLLRDLIAEGALGLHYGDQNPQT